MSEIDKGLQHDTAVHTLKGVTGVEQAFDFSYNTDELVGVEARSIRLHVERVAGVLTENLKRRAMGVNPEDFPKVNVQIADEERQEIRSWVDLYPSDDGFEFVGGFPVVDETGSIYVVTPSDTVDDYLYDGIKIDEIREANPLESIHFSPSAHYALGEVLKITLKRTESV